MPNILKARKAIAMIELIFSIVIMGIVLLSAPMLLSTATKSSLVAFQQESIAIAAAKANSLMTYAWDEANTKSQGIANQYTIISTASATTELNRTTPLRLSMTRTSTPSLSATTIANFGTGRDIDPSTGDIELIDDDVDDFNGQIRQLQLALDGNSTLLSDTGDYMDKDVNISTYINYAKDNPSSTYSACTSAVGCAFSQPFASSRDIATTTNIKRVITILTSGNVADKTIRLQSFMCNIGAGKINTEKF